MWEKLQTESSATEELADLVGKGKMYTGKKVAPGGKKIKCLPRLKE